MSFNKLTREELLRTLDEDFAFNLEEDEKRTKTTILAAITEGKLKFADYLAANPDQREKFLTDEPVATADPLSVEPEPITQPEPVLSPIRVANEVLTDRRPSLVKMTRQNPYYEIGSYKFSKEHPYVIVPFEDAESVLREEGFRVAFQSELEEFYS